MPRPGVGNPGNKGGGRPKLPIELEIREAQKKAKQKVLHALDVKGWAVIDKILDGKDQKTQATLIGKMLQLIIPAESEVTTFDGDTISKLSDDELKAIVRDYLQSIRGIEAQGRKEETGEQPLLLSAGSIGVSGNGTDGAQRSVPVDSEPEREGATSTTS